MKLGLFLIAITLIAFVVVQIARMAWRFLRGDEDMVSGDSFGWQLFGRRSKNDR